MQFHNPNFLWALGCLAIPVIIHLFNFRRYKRVVFSNVEMLKQIKTQSQKTRQLKKYLVLISRLLAIACIVLAFARPYLPIEGKVSGSSLYSIYLDNSNSMNAVGEKGQLFEESKNAAREIVQSLPQSAEVQIIDNNFNRRSAKVISTTSALSLIDELEISNEPNDINLAFQKANKAYNEQGFEGLNVFVVSDLQKTVELQESELDSNTSMYLVKPEPLALQNLSIDSAWLESPINKLGDPISVQVQISNNGDAYVESATLNLEVNDANHGLESFEIDAHSSLVLTMAFIPRETGWLTGSFSINDVPVVFDNDYYFSLYVKKKLRILEIGEQSENLQKVFMQDEAFELVNQGVGGLSYSDLGSFDFIITNELKTISSGMAEQLKLYVENGGVLCIVPGVNSPEYDDLLSQLPLHQYGRLVKKDISIDPKGLNNPFFDGIYKRKPENSFLPKLKSSYKLSGSTRSQQLLALKDGSPVLSMMNWKKGVVYQFGMPMDASISNFSSHELYVLTLLKMAFSKSSKQELATTLSNRQGIELPYFEDQSELVKLKNDESEVVVESSFSGGIARIWLNEAVSNAGVYQVLDEKDQLKSYCAINNSRRESRQEYYSNEELVDAFGASNIKILKPNTASIATVANDISSGRQLWKVFIILSLIFLMVEILLLRFIKS